MNSHAMVNFTSHVFVSWIICKCERIGQWKEWMAHIHCRWFFFFFFLVVLSVSMVIYIKNRAWRSSALVVLEAPHVPLWVKTPLCIKHQILQTKQCCSINTSEWMFWWIKSVIPICKLLRETPTHGAWETVSCACI